MGQRGGGQRSPGAAGAADLRSRRRFSATLNTPKGPARLNLPSAVATLQQYRTLEQAVSATNARLSAATADLARLRQELALQRGQYGAGGGMMGLLFPLLMQKQLKDDLVGHTHGNSPTPTFPPSSSSSSSFLPLLMLQPNLFGQSSAGSGSSQEATSPMLMAFLMMEMF